ncbi:MAG: single-stranded DNA-binding protein, partial [Actinobacteria bacterium]|nr:single-stranded DNA-binding protein [Actinomycetota bacterium]
MSNIFSGKKAAADKVEDDYIPGGGALDSDIYKATIKVAYIGKAQNSDARNVTLLLDVNGREVRNQIWVSNRQGDVIYKDKKTGEDKNLPGFNQMNSLCMLLCSKEMGDMEVEELTVKLYD